MRFWYNKVRSQTIWISQIADSNMLSRTEPKLHTKYIKNRLQTHHHKQTSHWRQHGVWIPQRIVNIVLSCIKHHTDIICSLRHRKYGCQCEDQYLRDVAPGKNKFSSCWTPLGLQNNCSLTSGESSILAGLPWSRYLPHPELGLDNPQAISKIKGLIHPTIPTKRLLAPWGECPVEQLSLFLTWLLFHFYPSLIIFYFLWSTPLLGLIPTLSYQIPHTCPLDT